MEGSYYKVIYFWAVDLNDEFPDCLIEKTSKVGFLIESLFPQLVALLLLESKKRVIPGFV